jgi:outer membrane protein TolC
MARHRARNQAKGIAAQDRGGAQKMSSRTIPAAAGLAALFAVTLAAQAPPEALGQPTRATQAPLSGRSGQPGSVATTQTALPGGGGGTVTINSTVQTQGAFQGSVPSTTVGGPAFQLSLDDAVKRGLAYNLGTVGYTQAVRLAQAQAKSARSNLLPTITADAMAADQQTDLAALGFTSVKLPIGSGFPTVIGPYHYVDLRAGLQQSLLDLTRLRNYRSAQQYTRAAQFGAQDARDLVVLAVTGAYLQVIASSARVETTRAQVAAAQATFQQATDRHNAGLAARIDVTRSQVELQVNQQRLISVQNDLAKQKIALGRLIGVPAAQDFTLTDTLPFAPLANLTLDQAIERAAANRADLKAAEAQVRAAEITRQAAAAERYPTIQVNGDYGAIGSSPTNAHGTFAVAGSVRFPIFQGGRVEADIEQADAALELRRAEYQELKGRIDADIHSAFLDLTSAANQISVAQSNRELAADTLAQARDRFASGIADTVEVVQAQEAVAAAEQDYIAALFGHNLAKASLARAMGQAGQNIQQFLGRP